MTKEERINTLLKDPVQARRSLLKSSMYHFMKEFWDEVVNEPFISNWHLEKVICPALERTARRVAAGEDKKDLVINVPPGTTKTITVSVMFPVWCWLNWPWMIFMTASYTEPRALYSATLSRELIRSNKFRSMFPEVAIKPGMESKSNFHIVHYKQKDSNSTPVEAGGGYRLSTSVTGTATGFHGHFFIVDDPIDPRRSVSEEERNTANQFMEQTVPHRKVNRRTCPTILMMQRLHQQDPSGRMLEIRKGKVEHVCLPGEVKNYRKQVYPPHLVEYYTEDGLLEPNRLGWEALDEVYQFGQYTYAAQIGQNPIPPEGGMFKPDSIPTIQTPPTPDQIALTIRYWDKAGTSRGGDYTVGVKMARLKSGKYIVLDVRRGQWATDERENIMRQTAEADSLKTLVYIEQEPGSGGKHSAEFTVKNLAGFRAYPDPPRGSKPERADPLSVQVNAGNVIMMQAVWNSIFIEELRWFPYGTYKDQVDAASGAFGKLTERKKARVLRR